MGGFAVLSGVGDPEIGVSAALGVSLAVEGDAALEGFLSIEVFAQDVFSQAGDLVDSFDLFEWGLIEISDGSLRCFLNGFEDGCVCRVPLIDGDDFFLAAGQNDFGEGEALLIPVLIEHGADQGVLFSILGCFKLFGLAVVGQGQEGAATCAESNSQEGGCFHTAEFY